MISSETDVRIFIDSHKSSNSYFFQKEMFIPYKQETVDVMARSKQVVKSEETFQNIVGNEVIVDEEYMMRKEIRRDDSEDSNISTGFELISKDSY